MFQYIESICTVLTTYIFIIHPYSEPFDATWGTGNQNTDFNSWCQTVGNTMFSMGLEWLVMCEGVADSPSCSDPC